MESFGTKCKIPCYRVRGNRPGVTHGNQYRKTLAGARQAAWTMLLDDGAGLAPHAVVIEEAERLDATKSWRLAERWRLEDVPANRRT